ncbi:hypothetical protein GLU64_03335 [Nanohaloarchaea archaeon]|nr:hypothetical protein [Candidatus Nanohaloarchaea archaeon]
MGIAIVLSSPFIVSSQSAVLELNHASQSLVLEESLDEVDKSSKVLEQRSYPARRSITLNIPEDVTTVYNPSRNNTSALVFSMEAGGENTNHSVVFDTVFSIDNTSTISEEGIHKMLIKKTQNGLNASVIQK